MKKALKILQRWEHRRESFPFRPTPEEGEEAWPIFGRKEHERLTRIVRVALAALEVIHERRTLDPHWLHDYRSLIARRTQLEIEHILTEEEIY